MIFKKIPSIVLLAISFFFLGGISATQAYDQVFPTVKLRYGYGYKFTDTFNNNTNTKVGLDRLQVSFTEELDFNGGANPTFPWSQNIVDKGYILNAGESALISRSTPIYNVNFHPVTRKSNNIEIVYTTTNYEYRNGGWTNKTIHTEYQPYEITWCGDGIVDNYTDVSGEQIIETCDPGDTDNRQGWGANGGTCSNTCQPVDNPDPAVCTNLQVNPNTGTAPVTSNISCTAENASTFRIEISEGNTLLETFNSNTASFTFDDAGDYMARCFVDDTITSNACKQNIVVDQPVPLDYDLALKKTVVGATSGYELGDDVTFAITVTNQGDITANSFSITDYIPEGLALNDAAWAKSGNTTTRTFNRTLDSGDSFTVNIRFTIVSNSNLTIENFAEISSDDGDDCDSTPDSTNGNSAGESTGLVDDAIGNGCNPGGDEDDHDIAVITLEDPIYDLALVKTLSSSTPGPFRVGNDVTFTIAVTNQGDVDAQEITITDYIPDGLTLNDSTWTQSGNRATRQVFEIAAGQTKTRNITFTITQAQAGTIENYAEISSDDGDDCDSTPDSTNGNGAGESTGLVDDAIGNGCNPGGDEDDHDIAVITLEDSIYDLALTKTLSGIDDTFVQGDDVTFIVTITNQGNVTATAEEIVDYIPSGLTLNDAAWTQNNDYAVYNQSVTLEPGQQSTINITFIINDDALGIIQNFAEISSDDGDDCDSTPDSINGNGAGESTNLDDDQIGMGCQPGGDEDDHDIEEIRVVEESYDIALRKTLSSATPGPFFFGDDVTFVIRVFNQGTVESGRIEVTDYIPEGLTLNDSRWTLIGENAVQVIDNIPAMDYMDLEINFTIDLDAPNLIENVAEITEDSGEDCDSIPDDTNGNDDQIDNEVGTGCDEDDGNDPDGVCNDGITTNDEGCDEDDEDPEVIEVLDREYDLALIKTVASTGPYNIGDTVTFTLTLENQGAFDSGEVEITDYIPTGLSLVADDIWTLNGNTATSVISNISVGDSYQVDITFTIDSDAPASISNFAEISVDDGDDCDSTPDSINGNGSGESTELVDDESRGGCNEDGDEDDHDIETITVEDGVAAVCNTLTASPSTSVSTLTSTLTCTGTDVNTYRIEVADASGNIVNTINQSSGTVTLSTIGTFTARCFVNDTITSNTCERTLSVTTPTSSSSSSSSGGGSPRCTDIIDNGNSYTCWGNNRVESITMKCGTDPDTGADIYLSPTTNLTREVSGARTAQFTCSDPFPRCYVNESPDTTFSVGEIGTSWITENRCQIQTNPICGDGIVQPELGEQCDMGTNNGQAGFACNNTCKLPTSSSSGGGGGGSSGSSSGGSSGDPEPKISTDPGAGEIVFGPQQDLIVGHDQNVLSKVPAWPFIENTSEYDYSFDQFCVKKTSGDDSVDRAAGDEICINLQNRMLYGYNKLAIVQDASDGVYKAVSYNQVLDNASNYRYPDFISNKDNIPAGQSYGSAVITTSIKDDIDNNGSIEELYDAYFAADLNVRVAKPAVVTIGGGTSYVKSTTSGDVSEITQGVSGYDDNKNFVGVSVGTGTISSYVETNDDITVIEDISKEVETYSQDVTSVTSDTTSTNVEVTGYDKFENYNGFKNVFIIEGKDIKLGALPALSESTTYIVEGGDLTLTQDIVSSTQNVAFVVKGGNIIIESDVDRLDGTYIAIPTTSGGGYITSESSEKQLVVYGSLSGDIDQLVNNRYYIEKSGNQLSPGTIVSFGSKLFSDTAPLVGKFKSEYLETQKVAK